MSNTNWVNGVPRGAVGVKCGTPTTEMEAFDAMSAELRQVVREAPVCVACYALRNYWRQNPPALKRKLEDVAAEAQVRDYGAVEPEET